MGLMDMLGGALSGNSGKAGSSGVLESVLGMVTQHSGGLGGLVEQLKAAGLDKQVSSWVGTGDNIPVSADQIKAALGSSKIAEIAKASGVSNDEAAHGLAKHLPDVVNQLTPDGNVPQGDLAAQAMAMLKSKFFG
ncbi:MAG: YidB family protein [Planctomycetota bacterium]